MDLGLAHRTALVTGASSGIGAATARILAAEGADVIVVYGRNEDGADDTARAVRAAGRTAWTCRMDLRDPDAVTAGIAALPAAARSFDVVILCAGLNRITPFAELTPAEWKEVLDVNLNGPFYVLQAVRPYLRDGASVVTVASVAAHTGAPHHAHYAAAKAGLVNLTKSAARALAPRVRVNCVTPGITLTPMGQAAADHLPDDYARTRLLTGRFAEPDEIARCIVFLASPAAAFITGATLDANGGRDLR